jgi:hypothetical protein
MADGNFMTNQKMLGKKNGSKMLMLMLTEMTKLFSP